MAWKLTYAYSVGRLEAGINWNIRDSSISCNQPCIWTASPSRNHRVLECPWSSCCGERLGLWPRCVELLKQWAVRCINFRASLAGSIPWGTVGYLNLFLSFNTYRNYFHRIWSVVSVLVSASVGIVLQSSINVIFRCFPPACRSVTIVPELKNLCLWHYFEDKNCARITCSLSNENRVFVILNMLFNTLSIFKSIDIPSDVASLLLFALEQVF